MTAALMRSNCEETIKRFSFQPAKELSECQWCRLDFWRQTVTRWRTIDWKASGTEASCSCPWHNQVTLTCRVQVTTCRDCRNRTDHRHQVRSGVLVKTLVLYTSRQVIHRHAW